MIDQINGIILNKKDSYVIVMVGGIGLRVNMSVYGLESLPNQGEKVQISTYLHVREDILDLWNNLDSEENIWFVSSLESIQKKLDKKEIDYEFLVYPNISNISQENPEYRMWKMYSQYLQNKKKPHIVSTIFVNL